MIESLWWSAGAHYKGFSSKGEYRRWKDNDLEPNIFRHKEREPET